MRVARLALIACLAACGDDGGSDTPIDAPTDGGMAIDAAVDGQQLGCELPVSLGTVVPAQATALFFSGGGGGGGGGGGPGGYQVDNSLTTDPTFDVVSLEMFRGNGAFAAGFPTTFPVTINLAGAELDYATCGACVRAFGDVTGNQWVGEYFATAGTVTLTALSRTRMTGTLQNITLTHVQKGTLRTMPLNDGCNTTLGELAFDLVPSMGFVEDWSARARRRPASD